MKDMFEAIGELIAAQPALLAERELARRIAEKRLTIDPWKHRSSGMLCSTCMWFVQKVSDNPGGTEIGRCRRHAPTMNGYPVVFRTDWCGDHKLDENKLKEPASG